MLHANIHCRFHTGEKKHHKEKETAQYTSSLLGKEEHDPSTARRCELRGHKWDMHCGEKKNAWPWCRDENLPLSLLYRFRSLTELQQIQLKHTGSQSSTHSCVFSKTSVLLLLSPTSIFLKTLSCAFDLNQVSKVWRLTRKEGAKTPLVELNPSHVTEITPVFHPALSFEPTQRIERSTLWSLCVSAWCAPITGCSVPNPPLPAQQDPEKL